MEQITLSCRRAKSNISIRIPKHISTGMRAALDDVSYCAPSLTRPHTLMLYTAHQFDMLAEALTYMPNPRPLRYSLLLSSPVEFTPAGFLRLPTKLAIFAQINHTVVLTLSNENQLCLSVGQICHSDQINS